MDKQDTIELILVAYVTKMEICVLKEATRVPLCICMSKNHVLYTYNMLIVLYTVV